MSQWNLFRSHNISLALNCRKQADTELFCSISIERSKKTSSRLVTFSHVRHFVSLVKIPSKSSWTHLELFGDEAGSDFSYLSTDSTTSFRR